MNPAPSPDSEPDANLDQGSTLRGLRSGFRAFERYTLQRKLGQGGMGVVWLAHDERLDLEVALKFLPDNLAQDETALDDLRRETRRCVRLNHPHIVRVYDLMEDRGRTTAAIAMEYVDGKSLAGLRLEKASRVFEVEEITPWVWQMCEALHYAHSQGRVVHRDLKPANLMVDARGKVRVMDFGIASSLSDSMSRVSKAGQQHSTGGTLPYMSPQQLMGFPPSAGDDVYSLGATIYELLTSKPPFFRGGDIGISRQIESQTPPSMAERRQELEVEAAHELPVAWEQTVAACLDKDPLKRPQSVAEVWERLAPTATAPSQAEDSTQDAEVTRGAVPEEETASPSKPAQGSSRSLLIPAALVAAIAIIGMVMWTLQKPAGKVAEKAAAVTAAYTPSPALPEASVVRPPQPAAPAPPVIREDIVVGEYTSLTGREAIFGVSSHEGTQMAIDELNAAGGLLGRKLRLQTEDDLSKAGEPARVVDKLISKDGVVAVLGEVASSRTLEGAAVCQARGIPMISPAATNPKVTEVGDCIFRACFVDPFQGTVMADFAWQRLEVRKVALLSDARSDYSKSLTKFFRERYIVAGGQIVNELEYNGGDKDFKGQLTAIKNSGAEAVYLSGYYTDAAPICIQARQVGLTIPFLGGDGWESDALVKVGGEAMEGNYFSTHFAPDSNSPKVAAFVEAYQKRYQGKVPDAMAALGYDSAMLLGDGIRRAGSTEGPKLRDALAATRGFETVTGKITLNAQRDAVKSAVIMTIQNGRFLYFETRTP